MRTMLLTGCLCLAGCSEPVDTGDGGAGGATTIPAPTVSATASFDACAGCRVGGVGGPCVEPDRHRCGVDGTECIECAEPGECEIGLCLDGQCAALVAPDGTECSAGICTAGICTAN